MALTNINSQQRTRDKTKKRPFMNYGRTPIIARTVFAVVLVVHDIKASSPMPID
jgi:hypothetical protein